MTRSITISALRVTQPIGDFFIGVINHTDLTQICQFDVRRINEETELDSYIGIQRKVSDSRIKEIREYVRTSDATFPTSIILSIDERCASWDEERKELTLSEYHENGSTTIPFQCIAKILDGQHRIKGLTEGDNYQLPFEDNGDNLIFQLNVSLFIGADIAEQANIFATVNLAQTKVNRSLVYDLAELSNSRSPQKVAHNIAVVLDTTEGSPFERSIKRLGVATPGRSGETLTQATFVESMLNLISDKPALDRHIFKKGGTISRPTATELNKLIFRGLFYDKKDEDIAKIIWSYFAAIRDRWPDAWAAPDKGNIIKRTNGFKAFMRLLPLIYKDIVKTEIGAIVKKDQYKAYFDKIHLKSSDFTVKNFNPGSSGESELFNTMKEHLDL